MNIFEVNKEKSNNTNLSKFLDHMENSELRSTLAVDSHHGIHIPNIFAGMYSKEIKEQFGKEILNDISDPNNEYYWESWETVVNNFEYNDFVLIQDMDLWLVHKADVEQWTFM